MNMKFWSFNHLFYIMLAALLTIQWFEPQFGKYIGVFFVFYGLLMINWRIAQITKEPKQ